MNNSYEYHLLCRWLAYLMLLTVGPIYLTPHKKGAICPNSTVGSSVLTVWTARWAGPNTFSVQEKVHQWGHELHIVKVIGYLVAEMESHPWAGTSFKDLFLSRSIFLIADFAQTLKQPAYRNLKRKVNLKVTSFKGATSKTFISFTTPLVLGNGLLSFIIPTSSPACLLWVQHQNPSPSIKGWFLAT